MNALLIQAQPCISRGVSRESKAPPTCATSQRLLTMGKPRSRILYVDDDPQLREIGEQVLVCSGYEVDTAENGAEAWAALHDQEYDLLITDNQMPCLTGVELIRKVRVANLNVAVVLTSGTLGALSTEELSSLRCAAVLPKPFTSVQLLTVIREAVRANSPRTSAGVRRPANAGYHYGFRSHRDWGINE